MIFGVLLATSSCEPSAVFPQEPGVVHVFFNCTLAEYTPAPEQFSLGDVVPKQIVLQLTSVQLIFENGQELTGRDVTYSMLEYGGLRDKDGNLIENFVMAVLGTREYQLDEEIQVRQFLDFLDGYKFVETMSTAAQILADDSAIFMFTNHTSPSLGFYDNFYSKLGLHIKDQTLYQLYNISGLDLVVSVDFPYVNSIAVAFNGFSRVWIVWFFNLETTIGTAQFVDTYGQPLPNLYLTIDGMPYRADQRGLIQYTDFYANGILKTSVKAVVFGQSLEVAVQAPQFNKSQAWELDLNYWVEFLVFDAQNPAHRPIDYPGLQVVITDGSKVVLSGDVERGKKYSLQAPRNRQLNFAINDLMDRYTTGAGQFQVAYGGAVTEIYLKPKAMNRFRVFVEKHSESDAVQISVTRNGVEVFSDASNGAAKTVWFDFQTSLNRGSISLGDSLRVALTIQKQDQMQYIVYESLIYSYIDQRLHFSCNFILQRANETFECLNSPVGFLRVAESDSYLCYETCAQIDNYPLLSADGEYCMSYEQCSSGMVRQNATGWQCLPATALCIDSVPFKLNASFTECAARCADTQPCWSPDFGACVSLDESPGYFSIDSDGVKKLLQNCTIPHTLSGLQCFSSCNGFISLDTGACIKSCAYIDYKSQRIKYCGAVNTAECPLLHIEAQTFYCVKECFADEVIDSGLFCIASCSTTDYKPYYIAGQSIGTCSPICNGFFFGSGCIDKCPLNFIELLTPINSYCVKVCDPYNNYINHETGKCITNCDAVNESTMYGPAVEGGPVRTCEQRGGFRCPFVVKRGFEFVCVETCPVYSAAGVCYEDCPDDARYADKAQMLCRAICPKYLIEPYCVNDCPAPNVFDFDGENTHCMPQCPISEFLSRTNFCVEQCMFVNISQNVQYCETNGSEYCPYYLQVGKHFMCLTSCDFLLHIKNQCYEKCPTDSPYANQDQCVQQCPMYIANSNKCVDECDNSLVIQSKKCQTSCDSGYYATSAGVCQLDYRNTIFTVVFSVVAGVSVAIAVIAIVWYCKKQHRYRLALIERAVLTGLIDSDDQSPVGR